MYPIKMKNRLSFRSAVVSLSVFAPAAAQSVDRPNILWIVSEDNTLYAGCYGDKMATTPNIDRLAGQGILYENAFCTAPVSAPSRSTLITGMFPPSIGTQHMRSQNDLPAFLHFYTEYLRKAGYYCVNNAKEDYNTSYPSKAAWDESSKKAEYKNRKPGQPFFQIYNTELSHESQIFNHPEKLRHDPAKVILPAYLPDLPETRYDRALYYDRIEDMDTFVGKVLKQLEDDGLAENTIVFYYGDNGGVLGRSKRFVYESGLHVPLIIRFPEKYKHLAPAPAGSRTDRLVSFVDFAPTMLSLAGLDIPAYMQGVPFLGEKAVKKDPEYIYAFRDRMDERYDMCRVVHGKRYKYIRNYMPHRIYGQHVTFLWRASGMTAWEKAYEEGKCDINQSRFWQTKPAEELYDIDADPDEIDNLAQSAKHTSILEEMRAAHKNWELTVFDTGFVPEAELKSRVAAEKTTPYDFVRNKKFPYERVLETAQTATTGNSKDFADAVKRLNDKEAVVRYWAAVACCIQPKLVTRSQTEQLFKIARTDSSPCVKIAAMEAIFKIGRQNEALTLIRDLVLNNTDDFVRLLAFNTIDTFGSAADDIRKEIAATYPSEKFAQSEKSFYSPRIIDYWRETIK